MKLKMNSNFSQKWLVILIFLFLILIISGIIFLYFGSKRWSCKDGCKKETFFGSFATQEDCESVCKPKIEIKEIIKYIDRPVEVEKIVEKQVEVPVEVPVEKTVYIDRAFDRPYPLGLGYDNLYSSYPYLTSNFPDLYPLPGFPYGNYDGWDGNRGERMVQKVNINQKVLHPKVNIMKAPTGPAKLKRK